MSNRTFLPTGGASLLRLADEEAAAVGGMNGSPLDAAWTVVVGTGPNTRLVVRRVRAPEMARRKHIAEPADDAGGEVGTERRFGMRIRLQRVGDRWALPLSMEQLAALGVSEADATVLVRLEDGDPPRLVVRRAPSFEEAMQDTLTQHRQALMTLAAHPESATGGSQATTPSKG